MQYNFYKLFWLLFPIFCILFIYEDIYTNYENTNEINLESHDVMVFSQSSILGLTSNCTYIPDTLSPCMNANDCAMHMCTIYNNPATDKLMLITDPRTQISPACNNISPKQGIIHDHTFGAIYVFSLVCLILIIVAEVLIAFIYPNPQNVRIPYKVSIICISIQLLFIIISFWYLAILFDIKKPSVVPYFVIIIFMIYDIIYRIIQNVKRQEYISLK